MWEFLNGFDAAEHTCQAAAESARRYAEEMLELQTTVDALQQKV